MKKYIICDTTNNIIASFNTWKEAELFKWIRGGTNWSIKVIETTKLYNRKSTEKQKRAVHFVEFWCDIEFKGDIDNFYKCSKFLESYLDEAKDIAQDAAASYYSEYLY